MVKDMVRVRIRVRTSDRVVVRVDRFMISVRDRFRVRLGLGSRLWLGLEIGLG